MDKSLLREAYLAGFLDAEETYKIQPGWRHSTKHPSTNPYWQSSCADAVQRILKPNCIFQVGDIVERWTSEHHWQYWTTIQTQEDMDSAIRLDMKCFRVIRACPVYGFLLKVLIHGSK